MAHPHGVKYGVKAEAAVGCTPSRLDGGPSAWSSTLGQANRPITEDTEPCKQLAELMSEDATYLIFRRFSKMNVRNLLRMQRELSDLEKQWDAGTGDAQADGPLAMESMALKRLTEKRLKEYS